MGLSESKAQVIDENDEYKNGVTASFDQLLSLPLPTSSPSEWSSVTESGVEALADVTSTAGNVVSLGADVLKTFGDETSVILSKCLNMLGAAKFFCEGAGIISNLVVDDAVVAQLNKIFDEISEARNDRKWDAMRTQYADSCTTIVTGMEFCMQIKSNAKSEPPKHDYEERLKELCSNQRLTLAINSLLDGITGKGDFGIDILQLVYDQTNGSRPDVMRMAGRLLQLLTGGLTTLLTYETLVRGRQSAEKMEQDIFADRVKEAVQCCANVVQRCVDESKENMAKDIDRICEQKKELKDLLKDICNELARKHDWLRFQCIACRHTGFLHCHGSRIDKRVTRFVPKDIICFYTSKFAPLNTFSSAEKEQINTIISKGLSIRTMLTAAIIKPSFYDSVVEYMNQTSDQRQCWVIGSSIAMPTGLKVYRVVSEGSYRHLCGIPGEHVFVSMFFQD